MRIDGARGLQRRAYSSGVGTALEFCASRVVCTRAARKPAMVGQEAADTLACDRESFSFFFLVQKNHFSQESECS